jgi:predicted nucleic acid-binding protein
MRTFVDTNVFVYVLDEKSKEKCEACTKWLQQLSRSEMLVTNLQVQNELANVLLKKARLPATEAKRLIEPFQIFGRSPLVPETVELAWNIRTATGFPWFDCLNLASALFLGCQLFLSEDLTHNRNVMGLTIINPMAAEPETYLRPQ